MLHNPLSKYFMWKKSSCINVILLLPSNAMFTVMSPLPTLDQNSRAKLLKMFYASCHVQTPTFFQDHNCTELEKSITSRLAVLISLFWSPLVFP